MQALQRIRATNTILLAHAGSRARKASLSLNEGTAMSGVRVRRHQRSNVFARRFLNAYVVKHMSRE
jgi:hypothetical protein